MSRHASLTAIRPLEMTRCTRSLVGEVLMRRYAITDLVCQGHGTHIYAAYDLKRTRQVRLNVRFGPSGIDLAELPSLLLVSTIGKRVRRKPVPPPLPRLDLTSMVREMPATTLPPPHPDDTSDTERIETAWFAEGDLLAGDELMALEIDNDAHQVCLDSMSRSLSAALRQRYRLRSGPRKA